MYNKSETHPKYQAFQQDWRKMRICYDGEEAVKDEGVEFLPPTHGMVLDGMVNAKDLGMQAYSAYRMRAIYHDFVSEAVETYLGMIFNRDPVFELPESMQYLVATATNRNEGLGLLLRRTYEEMLISGRCGLLLDMPEEQRTDPKFYLSLYKAETILNWDEATEHTPDSLNMVVLDESGPVRNGFSWKEQEKFRILVLGDLEDNEPAGDGVYKVTVQIADDNGKEHIPNVRAKPFNKIPFVFVNSKDILPDPDRAPLLGLANLALAIYRGEADYRQTLFLTGQDTLVIAGAHKSAEEGGIRIGNNAAILIDDPQGSAEFIGVTGQGLTEQRLSLETDRKRAEAKAGHLAAASKGDKESGDALRTRVNAQSASLKQIALTGAAALQHVLRMAAEWLGEDPETVKVKANIDFADDVITGQDVERIMAAKTMGAPLAMESIHAYFAKKNLTNKTFEQEMDLIKAEDPLPANSLTGMGLGNEDP